MSRRGDLLSKYLVISTAVIGQIHLSNGEYVGDYLGGAGIYALCGLRIWCDDVTLITGIGSDFYLLGINGLFRTDALPPGYMSVIPVLPTQMYDISNPGSESIRLCWEKNIIKKWKLTRRRYRIFLKMLLESIFFKKFPQTIGTLFWSIKRSTTLSWNGS